MFTPGESYCWGIWPLLLCPPDVFWALINSHGYFFTWPTLVFVIISVTLLWRPANHSGAAKCFNRAVFLESIIYEKCQLCMMVHAHPVWPVNTSSDLNHRFGLSSVSFKWTFYGLFHWIDILITSMKSWTYTTIFQWVSHIIYSSEINVFCDRWLLQWRSFKLCMIITSLGSTSSYNSS